MQWGDVCGINDGRRCLAEGKRVLWDDMAAGIRGICQRQSSEETTVERIVQGQSVTHEMHIEGSRCRRGWHCCPLSLRVPMRILMVSGIALASSRLYEKSGGEAASTRRGAQSVLPRNRRGDSHWLGMSSLPVRVFPPRPHVICALFI